MIIIGSAILLAIGLLILLWQAIAIAFSLLKIAYYLAKAAVYLAVIVVCAVCLAVQYIMRFLRIPIRWGKSKPEPQPVVTVNFYPDDEDNGPTIDLPRESFCRVRG
jgi:hypothetical protein